MRMGLRKILNSELAQKGYLTMDEVHRIARSEGHRESNAERRLRASESPYAHPVRSDDPPRAIVGYKWIGPEPEGVKIQVFNQMAFKI